MSTKPRTEPEMLAWGVTESAKRKEELEQMRAGQITLADVQNAAKKRRCAVGLSANMASRAVRLAHHAEREAAAPPRAPRI